MSNYGTAGMPKIAVLGGTAHTVFYNQNNAVNPTDIQSAINSALSATGIDENVNSIDAVTIYPNPANSKTYLSYSLKQAEDINIAIYNVLGEKVYSIATEKQSIGEHQIELNTTNLDNGIYYVNVNGSTFKLQVSN